MRKVLRAAALGLLLAGCAGPEAVELSGESVLAEVGGEKITLAEYRQYVERVPAELRGQVEPERYVEAIVEEELLVREAAGRGMDRDPRLQEALEQEQRVQVLRALYRSEGVERPRPGEEELRSYFARSPYNRRVRFSLLMVRTPEQIPPLLQALQKGADFEELSVRHSQDPRILERGGDMGYHRWGETMPSHAALTERAFHMQPGEIAGPLQVADGYFLIKATDVHPVSFEQERETIEELVVQELIARQLTELYARLHQRWELRYEDSGLEALHRSLEAGAPVSAPETRVAAYAGGELSLSQCLEWLRGAGRVESRQDLRRELGEMVGRHLLVPLEIDKQELAQTPAVRGELERRRREWLVRRLREQLAAQAPPPGENALRLFFEENRERYARPAQVEVRRLLTESREEGEVLVGRLREGRAGREVEGRFVALTYGGAAMEGENPVSRALREAGEGSFLGPFATDGGFVVLHLVRRHPARLPELEEVRPQVLEDWEREQGRQLFRDFAEGLRQRGAGQVKIYRERVQKLALLSYQGG